MTMKRTFSKVFIATWLFLVSGAAAYAGELKFDVQLIWGTNDDAPFAIDEDGGKKNLARSETNSAASDKSGAAEGAVKGDQKSKPAGSSRPKLKEVDSKLKDRLCGVFKWKHYYEVHRKQITAVPGKPEKHRLSGKCQIEVQNIGNSWIEVNLFGEGKWVNRVKQKVSPPELLVIAGDDKNDTAWFVVFTPR